MSIPYLFVSGYPSGNGDKMNVSCDEYSESMDDCYVFSSPGCSDQDAMALSCVGMCVYELRYVNMAVKIPIR